MKPGEELNTSPVYWYDETGKITQWGTLQEIEIQKAEERGERIRRGKANGYTHKLNLDTMRLNKITVEPAEVPVEIQRSQAYPTIGDQLGVIVEALRALKEGKPLPPEVTKLIDDVDAVKQRFPKK